MCIPIKYIARRSAAPEPPPPPKRLSCGMPPDGDVLRTELDNWRPDIAMHAMSDVAGVSSDADCRAGSACRMLVETTSHGDVRRAGAPQTRDESDATVVDKSKYVIWARPDAFFFFQMRAVCGRTFLIHGAARVAGPSYGHWPRRNAARHAQPGHSCVRLNEQWVRIGRWITLP